MNQSEYSIFSPTPYESELTASEIVDKIQLEDNLHSILMSQYSMDGTSYYVRIKTGPTGGVRYQLPDENEYDKLLEFLQDRDEYDHNQLLLRYGIGVLLCLIVGISGLVLTLMVITAWAGVPALLLAAALGAWARGEKHVFKPS